MGLIPQGWCRQAVAGLLACTVVALTASCSARSAKPVGHQDRQVEGSWQQRTANAFVRQLPCEDRDAYLDDLTFWDQMRGFDCVDGERTVSIRVYSNSRSVEQVLADWADSIVGDRVVRRGSNWFVVGPRVLVARLMPPADDAEIREHVPRKSSATAQQDFLTNCARYALDEAARIVKREPLEAGDLAQYEEFFPGVAAAVRAALTDDDLSRVRDESDEERWASMLSIRGAVFKKACRAAEAHPGSVPSTIGGSG